MSQNYIEAVFLREQKTRFLCDVMIDGQEVECYIPSSCKLSRFVNLAGKDVLLTTVAKKDARTRLALYAAKLGRSYVVLNLAEANRIVEEQLHRRYFSFLGNRKQVQREAVIECYKADLFIQDTQTIIEIKTLLSFEKKGLFPSVKSERAVKQLEKISELLDRGYHVCYIVISLNPSVKQITVNQAMGEYSRLFQECREKGMDCRGFSIKLKSRTPEISGTIKIEDFEGAESCGEN